MAGPEYPDVPKADGVPAVKRSAENPGTGTQEQLTSDEITVAGYDDYEWGIYKVGSKQLALEPDNVVSVGYDAEYRLADYPLEEGGFETYDKVALPFMNRIVLTKGGTREERSAFCAAIEAIRPDTELYSVVTPEQIFINVNIARVTIDRSLEAGAGMVRAEIVLQEIRQTASSSFSNTRDAASADAVNNGSNQPKASTAATSDVR